jgi:hypothetical protein
MPVPVPAATLAGMTNVRTTRVLTVTVAATAALVLWAVAALLPGVDLTVRVGGRVQPVGPVAVAASGLVAGLLAWALLAVLERLLTRPGRTWTVLAVVALVLSLAGPLGSGVGTANRLVLAAMHLAVAAVLIPGLRRTTRIR